MQRSAHEHRCCSRWSESVSACKGEEIRRVSGQLPKIGFAWMMLDTVFHVRALEVCVLHQRCFGRPRRRDLRRACEWLYRLVSLVHNIVGTLLGSPAENAQARLFPPAWSGWRLPLRRPPALVNQATNTTGRLSCVRACRPWRSSGRQRAMASSDVRIHTIDHHHQSTDTPQTSSDSLRDRGVHHLPHHLNACLRLRTHARTHGPV